MIDLLTDYFYPIMLLWRDFLTINVMWAGISIPVWGFFAFSLLGGIFVHLISVISGFHIGSKGE